MAGPLKNANRYRPHEHLCRPVDFQRVYQQRRSASNDFLLVYASENGLPYSRLGLSVARKVGSAPHRNRLRRLYREAFRLTRANLPLGFDIILIPRRTEEPKLHELQSALIHLVDQITHKGRRS